MADIRGNNKNTTKSPAGISAPDASSVVSLQSHTPELSNCFNDFDYVAT